MEVCLGPTEVESDIANPLQMIADALKHCCGGNHMSALFVLGKGKKHQVIYCSCLFLLYMVPVSM